jgi:hypothetical protein
MKTECFHQMETEISECDVFMNGSENCILEAFLNKKVNKPDFFLQKGTN